MGLFDTLDRRKKEEEQFKSSDDLKRQQEEQKRILEEQRRMRIFTNNREASEMLIKKEEERAFTELYNKRVKDDKAKYGEISKETEAFFDKWYHDYKFRREETAKLKKEKIKYESTICKEIVFDRIKSTRGLFFTDQEEKQSLDEYMSKYQSDLEFRKKEIEAWKQKKSQFSQEEREETEIMAKVYFTEEVVNEGKKYQYELATVPEQRKRMVESWKKDHSHSTGMSNTEVNSIESRKKELIDMFKTTNNDRNVSLKSVTSGNSELDDMFESTKTSPTNNTDLNFKK